MKIFLPLLFSFLITYWGIYFSIPFFKKFFLDVPNSRSSHRISKPRGYGIIFVLVGIFFSLIYQEYSLLLLVPLTFIGFLDDKYNISSKIRYLVQFFSSLSFIALTDFGRNFYSLISTESYILNSIFLLLFVIFSTAIINFTNFMDGIDGLVSGCMLVLITLSVFLNFNFLIGFVGSLLAFFIWNWSPSKIFMGDSGSTGLGGLFVLILLMNDNIVNTFGLLLVGTPLFADAFICVIRRFFYSQEIFKPHKLHLYQRLNQGGLNHAEISRVYIISTIILGINFLIFRDLLLMVLMSAIIVLIGCWLDRTKAKSFISCL